MRLFDRTENEELDPEVERQLEAIDRAVAGEEVEPDLEELATLTRGLRAERPEPSEAWRLEMDAKVGERFGASRRRSLRRLLLDRPLGRLAPAGALATVLVVVGVAISTSGDDGIDQLSPAVEDAPTAESIEAVPGGEPLGAGGASPSSSSADVGPGDNLTLDRGAARLQKGEGRIAPGRDKRLQDRDAFLALKTGTEDVREVSDRAIQITESAGGVVLSSELSEREMSATALLSLSIPTRELDSILDQLTDLATVESLNEAAVDITRPFVSAQDRLEDARAERTELLEALGNASSDKEAEALRKQLRDARRKISRAEASFDNIARRARNSSVSLEIKGSPDGAEDGSWDLGDAASDALSVLKTVAGVLLISAAILAPVGLLALAIYLIVRAVRRSRREKALDEG